MASNDVSASASLEVLILLAEMKERQFNAPPSEYAKYVCTNATPRLLKLAELLEPHEKEVD